MQAGQAVMDKKSQKEHLTWRKPDTGILPSQLVNKKRQRWHCELCKDKINQAVQKVNHRHPNNWKLQ